MFGLATNIMIAQFFISFCQLPHKIYEQQITPPYPAARWLSYLNKGNKNVSNDVVW